MPVLDEQSVWRAVSAAAADVGLKPPAAAMLRVWAAERMKDLPTIVFDRRHEWQMRPSFKTAIEHAARDLMKGVEPS